MPTIPNKKRKVSVEEKGVSQEWISPLAGLSRERQDMHGKAGYYDLNAEIVKLEQHIKDDEALGL